MRVTTVVALVLALSLGASAISTQKWHDQLENEARLGKRISADGMTAWSDPHSTESFLGYEDNKYHQYDNSAGTILRDGATMFKRNRDTNKEMFTGYLGNKIVNVILDSKRIGSVMKVTGVTMQSVDGTLTRFARKSRGWTVDPRDGKTLRILTKSRDGKTETRLTLTPHTLNALAIYHDNNPLPALFWRQRVITANKDRSKMDVGDLIASIRDFLQFYADQHNRILTGVEENRLAGSYDRLKQIATPIREVLRSSVKFASTTYKRIGASNLEPALWASMSNALKDQMGHLENWAPKIQAIYEADDSAPFVTDEQAQQAFSGQVWSDFAKSRSEDAKRAKARNQKPELSKFSRDLLDKGTDAGAKALSGPIRGQVNNWFAQNKGRMDPAERADTERAIQYLNSGAFQTEIKGMLTKSLGNSRIVAVALNGVGDLADDGKQLGKNIGDWAKGLFSSKTKKAKVNKAIDQQGGVDPGEKEVVEAFASNKGQSQANELANKKAEIEQQGWKFNFGKPSIKPKFDLGAPGLIKELNIKWKMEVASSRTKASLDVDLSVKNPLDPNTASAVAKVDFKVNGNHGGVQWAAGATVTAEVTNLYVSPTAQKVSVAWFATAKKGRLSTGFFGGVNVPLTEDAFRAGGGKGVELNMRGNIRYDLSEDKKSYVELYGRYRSNSYLKEFDYAAGARLNLKTSENSNFYMGIEHGSSRTFGGDSFNSRSETRATIGFKIRF